MSFSLLCIAERHLQTEKRQQHTIQTLIGQTAINVTMQKGNKVEQKKIHVLQCCYHILCSILHSETMIQIVETLANTIVNLNFTTTEKKAADL
jgi:hypothetical protein